MNTTSTGCNKFWNSTDENLPTLRIYSKAHCSLFVDTCSAKIRHLFVALTFICYNYFNLFFHNFQFFADALQCEHDMTTTIYRLQQALKFDRRKPPNPSKLLKAIQVGHLYVYDVKLSVCEEKFERKPFRHPNKDWLLQTKANKSKINE